MERTVSLNDVERSLAVFALQCKIESDEEHAADLEAGDTPSHKNLAKVFRDQIMVAKRVIEKLEAEEG